MRILFDQGTPLPLRRVLSAHSIETAWQRGWSEISNGELLTAAELAGFDVFITTDQNLRYQQKSFRASHRGSRTHDFELAASRAARWQRGKCSGRDAAGRLSRMEPALTRAIRVRA